MTTSTPPGSVVGSGCCPKPATRTLFETNAGVTQLVEYLPSKQAVASSSLVPRSMKTSERRENLKRVRWFLQLNAHRVHEMSTLNAES